MSELKSDKKNNFIPFLIIFSIFGVMAYFVLSFLFKDDVLIRFPNAVRIFHENIGNDLESLPNLLKINKKMKDTFDQRINKEEYKDKLNNPKSKIIIKYEYAYLYSKKDDKILEDLGVLIVSKNKNGIIEEVYSVSDKKDLGKEIPELLGEPLTGNKIIIPKRDTDLTFYIA